MRRLLAGILTDSGYEEAAVNIPNAGYIADLLPWLAVEVPAIARADRVQRILLEIPAGICGLLGNQIEVHNLMAEAVLQRSRDLAIQALLVDPVVTVSRGIPELVDHMIAEQSPWLNSLS